MDDRGRGKTRWRRPFLHVVVLLAGWAGVSGCVGPKAIRYTRIRYNEVVRDTNDEQLLLNIVRLRYADSPVFIDLPNITSQFELTGRGSYFGGYGNQYRGRSNLGYGELSLRDTPTLSYHPREGREIAKSLLTPLSADLFIVVNAGADVEQLMLLAVNDINDVPNARGATLLTPKVADDNTKFVRGIRLLESLRQRDGTELGVEMEEETLGSSDPIARRSVQGRDLVNAFKDGYVYRAKRRGSGDLAQEGKGAHTSDPSGLRPIPGNGGSGTDLQRDTRPEQVPDQIRVERGGQPGSSQPAGKRHDLSQHAVGIADHDLSLQGCLRPRGPCAVGCRTGDARTGRHAL